MAHAILTIPVNPAFGSLNLAQAVVVTAYEWFRQGSDAPAATLVNYDGPAPHEELEGLIGAIDDALDRQWLLQPGQGPRRCDAAGDAQPVHPAGIQRRRSAHVARDHSRVGAAKALKRPQYHEAWNWMWDWFTARREILAQ